MKNTVIILSNPEICRFCVLSEKYIEKILRACKNAGIEVILLDDFEAGEKYGLHTMPSAKFNNKIYSNFNAIRELDHDIQRKI